MEYRSTGDRTRRPLVVTRDEELLDELLQLAGTAGVQACVAVDARAAEEEWSTAPFVVVGADRSGELARRGLPRRMGVVVVAGSERADDRALWSAAEALHAEHVLLLPDARGWLVRRFAEHRADCPGRATVVAVIPASGDAGAHELAVALAVTGSGQGYATGLLSASLPAPTERLMVPEQGSLALLWLGQAGEPGVAAEVMAAALQASRAERDLVVLDLPYGLDQASLLALTCADRAHLLVVADVKSCAAAAKLVATVRRHCPALSLVVRAVRSRGLRPMEVAQALDLPLAAVIPPEPASARVGPASAPPLARVSRRLLTDLDLRCRLAEVSP